LIHALINFEKPLVAAVQGAAIGGGTTMLAGCDFVHAGESAKFQLPFVNLALVPQFGSSYLPPLRFGYTRAAELILLGGPFDASRAAELGLVTQVVPDQSLLATATTARSGCKTRRCGAGFQAPNEAGFTRTIGASSETGERGVRGASAV
jgi:enoyl-CoA hydratase/carnithine racemase